MTEGPISPGSWPAPEDQSSPLETTVAVVPAAPSARHGQQRGRRSLLAAIVVVVVGAVAAAVVVVQRDPRTAEEALAGAQRFVGEATSFRFTYAAKHVMSFGAPDGSGSETTTRSTGSGEWSEGRWHSVTDTGFDMVDESILGGGKLYNRFAEDAAALEGEQWDSYPAPPVSREDMLAAMEEMAGFADEVAIGGTGAGLTPDELDVPEKLDESFAVMTAVMIYLGGSGGPTPLESGLGGDPSGLLDAIKQMAAPQRVSDDGGTFTVATTLQAPTEFADALGQPIPDGQIELDVDADDVPVALRLRVVEGDSSAEVEIEFSDWNTSIEITVPSGDEIDPTPWLEEDELRAVSITPVRPTSVPDNLTLSSVSTWPADDEFGECESIQMDWTAIPPSDDEPSFAAMTHADYLNLTVSSAACALDMDPTPFEPGGPGGLLQRNHDRGYVEVRVGDSVVAIDSTLNDDELAPVLVSLAPTDIETLIAEAAASEPPGWAIGGP